MSAPGNMSGGGFGTFWLLFGLFGPTMTIEQLRDAYFPSSKLKTMANKHSAGLLPPRTGDVYDTRDVASWWGRPAKGSSSLGNAKGRPIGGPLRLGGRLQLVRFPIH